MNAGFLYVIIALLIFLVLSGLKVKEHYENVGIKGVVKAEDVKKSGIAAVEAVASGVASVEKIGARNISLPKGTELSVKLKHDIVIPVSEIQNRISGMLQGVMSSGPMIAGMINEVVDIKVNGKAPNQELEKIIEKNGASGDKNFYESFGKVVGYYSVDNLDIKNNKWGDATLSGNGFGVEDRFVTGKPQSIVTFPKSILPSNYTLIHVTKYNGPSKKRILSGNANNWLSGHWNGNSGVAYHDGWITNSTQSPDFSVNDLVISVDQRGLYRANGKDQTKTKKGTNAHMVINTGQHKGESSDWAIAEILVYDSELSMDKIKQLEGHFIEKYRINYGGGDIQIAKISGPPEKLTDEQAKCYLNNYVDLKNAFGTDLNAAKNHWINYGKKEGRDPSC